MELKLREVNTETKKTEVKQENNLTEDYVSGVGNYQDYNDEPIKIAPKNGYENSGNKSSNFDIASIIKWIVIAVVIVIAAKFVINIVNPKVTDLTSYINMETKEVEDKLDVKLAANSNMSSKVNHYSRGTVTVDGNDDFGVVYIDGEYAGLHTQSKKYSLFGVKIGDAGYGVEDKMTFDFDESICVLNDMAAGNSTATFYADYEKGDCFVVITNDHSNKVVALTYFSDYAKVTETLDSIE